MVVAVGLLVLHVPRVVRTMNTAARTAPNTQEYRLIETGDTLDIPYELSYQALTLIPPRATWALLLPNQEIASDSYGIGAITYETVFPWLRYLLLPARPVADVAKPHYVICWGCNTAPWDHHTTWLWRGEDGAAIGRVNPR